MSNIEIINARKEKPSQPYDLWGDRRTPVGNPFILGDDGDRDEVCDKYERWINKKWRDKDPTVIKYLSQASHLLREHGKLRLFCWCSPKRCHLETVKKLLENFEITQNF